MCGFAQTTSSSYSTRNKYESYLLAKEEHDYLLAAVGRSNRSVSWGLSALAQLCVCHFEQVEAQSSKKNLLSPVIEMLQHDAEALSSLLHRLEDSNPPDDIANTLIVLRTLTGKKMINLLGPSVARDWAVVYPNLTGLLTRMGRDGSKSDQLVMAAIILVIGLPFSEPLPPQEQTRFVDLITNVLERNVHMVFTGRTLVNRLCNAPEWLLRSFSISRLLKQTVQMMEDIHKEMLYKLPRNLLRLLANMFLKADPAVHVESFDGNWEPIMTRLMAFGATDALVEPMVRSSVRAVLRALCVFRPNVAEWVKGENLFVLLFVFLKKFQENCGVADLDELDPVDIDDSSEERRNAEGKRRAVTALGRKKMPMKPYEPKRRKGGDDQVLSAAAAPSRFGDDGLDGGDDADMDLDLDEEEVYDLKNETEEQKIRRIKREREKERRELMRLKREEEERQAAERRERAAIVPSKRPRKPAMPLISNQNQPFAPQVVVQQPKRGGNRLASAAPPNNTGAAAAPTGSHGPDVKLQLEKYIAFFFFFFFFPIFKNKTYRCVLEAQVQDRDLAIASLETAICILQGNARFWNGLMPVYSQKEAALVRANAAAILVRLDGIKPDPRDLHPCIVCREHPGFYIQKKRFVYFLFFFF